MARKSRKHSDSITHVNIDTPSKSTPAAGYVRLSVKDLKQEGDSIETQKKIILDYINNHSELYLFDFYIDDGISGTTFERASFIRMIEDVEKGRIGSIVVKDITRFGRNALDTATYVTKYFPSKGVRFISINDDFDTARDDVDLVFTLKSLFSEYYASDIGNKVRSVIKHQMKDGKFVGSRPPFGYTKSVKDCHQLVVVKQIFGWAEKGSSISEIVRLLNELKIATPSHYWLQMGIIQNVNMTGNGLWQARTVSKILSNEVYTGKLVQGKTRIIEKMQRAASFDNLIEVENTHEPIIPVELFERIHETLGNKSSRRNASDNSSHEIYSPNLFIGKVFCAHCGSSLNRKKNPKIYIYRCATKYSAPGRCIGSSIKEEALIKAISEQIFQYIEILPEDTSNENPAQHELEMIYTELSYKEHVLPDLLESLHNGDIFEEEFRDIKSKQQQKFDQLELRREQLSLRYEEQEATRKDWCELKSALYNFSQAMELTQYLVDRLLQRIEIYNDGKVFLEFKIH